MRSEAQRQASRNNGRKSKGPITPDGKDTSKFNGLTHGLRSGHAVLPGESAAEFNAELKGWGGDWQPAGHTAAVLVERAAVASWRLRRCVRAEAGLLLELAAEKAAEARRDDHDADEVRARVNRADEDLYDDPAGAVQELRSFPEGIDRLLSEWRKLEDALDDGAEAWDDALNRRATRLLGRDPEVDAAAAGPLAEDSARLAAANELRIEEEGEAGRLAEPGASAMVAALRRGISRQIRELRELRATLVAPAAGAEAPADAKFSGVTHELMLMHRYEMGIERQLRATIRDLAALRKAGMAGGPAAAVATEVVDAEEIKEKDAEPEAGSGSASPAAPSEPEPVGFAGRPGGSRGDRPGLPRPRRRRKGRRSPR